MIITKKLISKFIVGAILCSNFMALSHIAKAYDGFVAGPKIVGFVGGMHTMSQYGRKTKENSEIYVGGGTQFTVFGGYIKEITFLEVGAITELTYSYNGGKVSRLSGGMSEKPQLSNLYFSCMTIPLFFRIAVPVIKIHTGPRARIFFGLKEKKLEGGKLKPVKNYKSFYIDWCTKFILGFQVYGVEAGLGFEWAKPFGEFKKGDKKIHPYRQEFYGIASIQYDVLGAILK